MIRPARALFYGSAVYHLSLAGATPRGLGPKLTPWPGDPERGAALMDGVFRFAGETVTSAEPPWQEERPETWRSELFRFGWLADLAALGSAAAAQRARQWTAEWVHLHHVYDRVAWRADVIGDRLAAWLAHSDWLHLGEGSGSERRALLASFARQARHLDRVVMREGTGLARLAALRGHVAAAAALGRRRGLERALGRLEHELARQFLGDGGHRARSPAAQLASLRYLADIKEAVLAAGALVPDFLAQAIERAGQMLRFFRHGDGGLALFNGSGEDEGGAIDLALARAGTKGRTPLTAPDTGFERLQAGGTVVLFDCGLPAPPGFDGDAHAGMLAFEMSHGRERIIVNCGVDRGAGADWRAAMRATAAHSTLIVADTNAAEIRADGGIAPGPHTVTRERADRDGNLLIAASHDGYRANFGLVHRRQLALAADGEELRGEDALTGTAGRAFAIRFHLHPAVEAALLPEGKDLRLLLPSGGAWRMEVQGAVLSLGESVYGGAGAPQKTRQIVLDAHLGTHAAAIRWAIRRDRAGE